MITLSDEQKNKFKQLYEDGDIFGLLFLRDVVGQRDKKLSNDIKELIYYNYVVVDMECGYIDWSQSLMDRYTKLKEKLFFIANINL